MNRPLRILFVTKSTGGVAEYVRQLVKGLDRDEFQITVACLSENGPEFAAELAQIPNVDSFSLSMNRYKVDPFSDTRVLFALARHLRQEKYDLVHAHASKPGFLARLAAIGTGIPVLYSPHCFAFHAGANPMSATIVAALERLAARYFTARIVAIADGERKLAQKYNVGSDELFVTVYTGIDVRLYQQFVDKATLMASLNVPVNAPLVGTVGRLSRQKSPLDFVRMAAIVHKRLPDVHFVWIGSGPLKDPTYQLSTELGLNGVLHFAGHRTDIPALLQCMDCFVLPSLWEGFPIVLLEAMAAGAPIVATNIPGNDEAIRSGVDGWLVPVRNSIGLAESVVDLLTTLQRAKAFGGSSRQRVEQKFAPGTMLDGLASLYRQVAQEHNIFAVNHVARKESL
jgi:glycosyltransferase involved in cell wall biosynthesis